MGRLFDSPMTILIIAAVVLLLFGAPKLPEMARSLGQSMRILKSEVKESEKEDKGNTTPPPPTTAPPTTTVTGNVASGTHRT